MTTNDSEQNEKPNLEEQARQALDDFWRQLKLSPADQAELWTKRGLPAWECERAGYRTNCHANCDVLLRLAQTYEPAVLLESGLWVQGDDGESKPNSLFYGFGLIGRKGDQEEWGWKDDGKCNPILIPYFDAHGQLFHLRPHKGGIAGKPPHLYVVRTEGAADARCNVAVVTEGEHKARALNAVLNGAGLAQFAVGALPGISMAKNETCRQELLDWLQTVAPERVVIAYDNEEQSEPGSPYYKPDKRKRHQAHIWARYLAQTLARENFDASVAVLPKEWRVNGKADWDSRLATHLAEFSGDGVWSAAAPVIRQEWLAVLGGARKPHDLARVFTDEEERLIRAGLHKLFRKPALRCGGGEELELSRKLRQLARGPLHDIPSVHALGEKYSQVIGVYYALKQLDAIRAANMQAVRSQGTRDGDANLVWFCDLQQRGDPIPLSDFRLTCHYVLVKEDGTCDRIVTLENIHGEKSELVALPSRALTAPRDFREWLANRGNFVWLDGEKTLQKLQEDLNRDAAHMRVLEVSHFGFHQPSGLWFFNDMAFGLGGEPLLPDEYGVFWWKDIGYKLGEQGADHQDFRQPRPCLHPNRGLIFDGQYRFQPGVADDLEAIRGLFQELAFRLNDTSGGREGYALVGSMAAYAAAPEILRKHGGFPGPWINGQKGHGKTTLISWAMEMYGFSRMESGIGLASDHSTPAGLQIALEQFSNLPVWVDEYIELLVSPEKRAIVHSTFNRELPSKFAEKGRMRAVRTTFVVSGEGTTNNAATRSRYFHLPIDRAHRRADQRKWFDEHRDMLAVLGRFLMQRRPQFAELCLVELSRWLHSPELATIEERTRFVYGVPYAGFAALSQLSGRRIEGLLPRIGRPEPNRHGGGAIADRFEPLF
jgi:hypothetical protein